MTLPDSNTKEISKLDFLLKVKELHEQLLESLDYFKIDALQDKQEELIAYLTQEIEKTIVKTEKSAEAGEVQTLAAAVFDEVIGFGPVEPLLRDKTITDIFINAPDAVYVESFGRVQKTAVNFLDNDHILRLVHRVASKSGRHLDLGTPYFDSQLPDGSRIHAII
ncbi:MAG TPA: hypothetical protein VGP47_04255, partial [Parachlamydiaceae bacterium]|nr:hypothetical protein [Parachlamydiaceae bacterium]